MNELKRRPEFRSVLADYKLSPAAQTVLAETKLVLLTAPTAGGRNTIINELLKSGDYHYIVSDTTRQPRVNNGVPEQNGREYWFRTEEELLDDLRHGEFLEAEIIHGQQVSGVSIRELKKARDAHKIAINEVDIGGFLNVMQLKPDTVAIVVLPPSFDEWQRRIKDRGDMPEDELRRRLETAVRIFETAASNEKLQFVINDKLEDAVAAVHNIAKFGQVNPAEQQAARQLAERLYQQTSAYLAERVAS